MIQIYFASISKGRDLLAEGGSMLTQVLRIVTFYFVCSIECTEDLVSDVGRILLWDGAPSKKLADRVQFFPGSI